VCLRSPYYESLWGLPRECPLGTTTLFIRDEIIHGPCDAWEYLQSNHAVSGWPNDVFWTDSRQQILVRALPVILTTKRWRDLSPKSEDQDISPLVSGKTCDLLSLAASSRIRITTYLRLRQRLVTVSWALT
jgi:hypothetical protein